MLCKKISLMCLAILFIFGILISLMLFVGFFIKSSIHDMFQNIINHESIMKAENCDLWGNFTEKKKVKIKSNARFYNYLSYNNNKYQVQETPYIISDEHHVLKELSFHNKGKTVSYFTEIQRKNMKSEKKFKAKIPNFLGYFVWNQVKNLKQEDRTWMAVSVLVSKFVENDFFKKQIVTGVLHDQLGFTNQEFVYNNLLNGLDLDQNQKKLIFEDSFNGFNTKHSINRWIEFIDLKKEKNLNLEERKKAIANYFNILQSDVQKIYNKLERYYQEVEYLLKTVFNCEDLCTSYDLFKRQWGQSELSLKLLQQDTVVDNETAFGYLEFQKFYNEKFAKDKKFANCELSKKQVDLLMDVDLINLSSSQKWNTLIHKQNLNDIFEIGKVYEKSKNENIWLGIVQRFQLKNVQQAIVVYEYLKYIGDDFLKMKDLNGTMEVTAFTNIFSEYYKKYFELAIRYIREDVTKNIFVNYYNSLNIDCETLLKTTLPYYKEEKVNKFCKKYLKEFGSQLYQNCEIDGTLFINELSKNDYFYLCQEKQESPKTYYQIKKNFNSEMGKIYNLQIFNVESLTMKQFINSTLTQTENKYLDKQKYPISQSLNQWNNKLFPQPLELNIFAKESKQEKALEEYTMEKIRGIFNDDRLFNGIVVQRAVLLSRQKNFEYFKKMFNLQNYDFFESYLKHFIKNVVLDGDFLMIDDQQAVDGIILRYLEEMKDKPILKGGDPSVPYLFQVLKPSEEVRAEKYTGKSNIQLIDRFITIQNKPYAVSNPVPYFNGNNTIFEYLNPWKEKVKPLGSESQIKVFRDGDNLENPAERTYESSKKNFGNFFISPLGRYLRYDYVDSKRFKDTRLKGEYFKVNETEFEMNDKNDVYYQNVYEGVWNLTKIFNAPIYLTRNHFYNVETDIANKIDIYDQKGDLVKADPAKDDLTLILEQFTKTAMYVNVNVQANIRIEKNEIFQPKDGDYDRLMPLFNIHTLNDMDDESIKAVLGPLPLVYLVLENYYIFVIILLIILILLLVLCFYGINKLKNKIEKEKQNQNLDQIEKNENLLDLENKTETN